MASYPGSVATQPIWSAEPTKIAATVHARAGGRKSRTRRTSNEASLRGEPGSGIAQLPHGMDREAAQDRPQQEHGRHVVDRDFETVDARHIIPQILRINVLST